jgi:hypothetical protein
MKTVATQAISVILISGLVIGGWYLFLNPEFVQQVPVKPEQFEAIAKKPETNKPTATTTVMAGNEPAQQEEALTEPVNISGAYEYFDEEGIPAEAAEEYRQISVLLYNPKVVECKDAWTTEGGATELRFRKVCTAQHKYPKHPYFEFETENLLGLANSHDPLAAAVLAERLTKSHPFEAILLRLYSAVSTGKPAPMLQIAEQHYPIEGVLPNIRESNLLSHYAHVSAAKRMGHPAADLSFVESAGSDRLVTYQRFADAFYDMFQAAQPHTESVLTPEMEASILGKLPQQETLD